MGDPIVLLLTSLTEKLTAGGTETLTISCAPADPEAAAQAMTAITATRRTSGRADPLPLIAGCHA